MLLAVVIFSIVSIVRVSFWLGTYTAHLGFFQGLDDNMRKLVIVDVQLIEDVLTALNEIPNTSIKSRSFKTYDLASKVGDVLLNAKSSKIEVLQDFVDSIAMKLIGEISVPNTWLDLPYFSNHVVKVHHVVKALNMIDRFNYNMDMLGRTDLIIPDTEKAA